MNTTDEFLAARTTDGLRAEFKHLDRKISSGHATEGEWKLAKVIEAEILRRWVAAGEDAYELSAQ
jgi:hypothetical protein